jgi:TfoX/Sxy family transcriptional regulator of competence genes
MAFNEQLNERINLILGGKENITCKKMFGGIGYLLNGNMVCGVYKDDLILRMSPEDADKSLSQNHVTPFDITGRAMKGWIMVEPDGIPREDKLTNWINISLSYVKKLPPK